MNVIKKDTDHLSLQQVHCFINLGILRWNNYCKCTFYLKYLGLKTYIIQRIRRASAGMVIESEKNFGHQQLHWHLKVTYFKWKI